MLLQSRPIHKLTARPSFRNKVSPKPKPLIAEKVKFPRCKFKIIPQSTKVVHSYSVHYLYGDIPVMKFNNKLITDISFFNEYKVYRNLQALEMYSQKVLIIKAEDKGTRDFSEWMRFVEELKGEENLELVEWGTVIQKFCQKYQRILGRQCRKKPKSDLRRNYFVQVNEETEARKKELFENFPCVLCKFRLKTHQNQLNEIVFNEKFIKDLGYTIEAFADVVIQEGIPQILRFENNEIGCLIRKLLDKYFTLGTNDFDNIELEGVMNLKHGYVREVKYKIYCLMNYENNSFGIDLVVAILDKGEPYLNYLKRLKQQISDQFIQLMETKEEETRYFLACYYNTSYIQQYSNLDKVCEIKEMSPFEEDDIIVKKDEEEF